MQYRQPEKSDNCKFDPSRQSEGVEGRGARLATSNLQWKESFLIAGFVLFCSACCDQRQKTFGNSLNKLQREQQATNLHKGRDHFGKFPFAQP